MNGIKHTAAMLAALTLSGTAAVMTTSTAHAAAPRGPANDTLCCQSLAAPAEASVTQLLGILGIVS